MASRNEGDLYDFENMTDDEVRQIVLEQLRDSPSLDADDIDVDVVAGVVSLSGRVGTDSEVQVAEAIIDDLLGIDRFINDLVVDALRRGSDPSAADDTAEMETERGDRIGGGTSQQSDTADHLVEDLDAETHGTRDMGEAIRDGATYTPPDGPGSDGYGSREDH